MSNTYKDLQNSHPCFGGQKNNAGRIHLPVSPGCNIACRFCDRTINDVEERPGVTSKILTPEEAEDILRKALDICPDIKVAGIAGPGDTLASDNAFNTFKIIKEKFPDLIKCMSTNGLLLNERAQDVIDVGIDSLTVTVIYKCNLIEELGVRLWNVRTSLNAVYRLVIDKPEIFVGIQIILNVSARRADDVYVDRKSVTSILQQ